MTTYGPLTDPLIRAWDEGYNDRRKDDIGAACRCYDGDHPQSVEVLPGDPNDNMRINNGRALVRSCVQALYGVEPTWSFSTAAGDAAFKAFSDPQAHVGAPSGFLLTLQKIATNASKAGTGWYKIVPRQTLPPRIVVIDPGKVDAFWDDDDHEDPWAFLIRWAGMTRDGDPMQRRQIIERLTDESWLIRDEVRVKDARAWSPVDGSPVVWDYPWPPIGWWQNLPHEDGFYGQPDLTPETIDLVYKLNSLYTDTKKIIRLHAHPKLVGVGFDADSVQVGPDEMLVLPSKDAELRIIEMQSDLASTMGFLDRVRSTFHETTFFPEVATGKLDNVGQLSGLALQILYGPRSEATEQKRLTAGPAVEAMLNHVFELMGVAAVATETGWPEIVPSDPVAERQVAEADQRLGASKETILANLGYDAKKELAASQAEAEASLEAQAKAFDAGAQFQKGDGG